MKIKLKSTIFILLVLYFVFSVCSCSSGSNQMSFVGEYKGTMGSEMIIKQDGTCSYLDASYSTSKDGKWKIEDNQIIFSECYSLDLYADISEFNGSFVLKCKSWMWADETFRKVQD